jgi:lysyl-tRNA synthetase class 2
VEEARREKLAALRELGVNPFAYRFERSHTSAQGLAAYTDDMGDNGPEVTVAGRLVSFRGKGKTAFGHLEDVAGRIQIYLRKDDLGDAYQVVKLLDLDDHLGVTGELFRTKTGEVTVRARTLTLLAKAVRPLPRGKTQTSEEGETVTYGGLQDAETRYRQRYADLAVHPEVRRIFRTRARAVSYMRRFLEDRDFLEVETPILQPLYGGAAALPFVTHHNALDTSLYLRIADELYLKRLLVGGLERVYEIGHDFRNEGLDRTHNPEFTMLEFYQAYADYHDMMDIIEAMVSGVVLECRGSTSIEYLGKPLNFTPPWPRKRFYNELDRTTGIDVQAAGEDDLRRLLAGTTEPPEDLDALTGGKLLDEVFKTFVEPTLVQPTFIIDYPRALSPLAKIHRDDPALVERFELFVNGKELANAFSELNDPDDQRSRFEGQVAARESGDTEVWHASGRRVGPRRGSSGHGPDRFTLHPRRHPVPDHAAGG